MSQRIENQKIRFVVGLILVVAFAFLFGGCRKYPNCRKDLHCERYDRGTPFCVNRICSECRDDSVCEDCTECNDGSCERIPGCCRSDSDCPSPGRCWVDERPVQDGELGRCGPQCWSDQDCEDPVAQMCDGGRCVERPECVTDDDCAALDRCLDAEGVNQCRCRNNECRLRTPEFCSLDTIYFDFDEYALRRDARTTLEGNVECLDDASTTGRANQSFTIEGHCDERGTEEYNMALGERRARAAENFLEDAGIDEDRMDTISYGESRPTCRQHNESCWSENRRAEFEAN